MREVKIEDIEHYYLKKGNNVFLTGDAGTGKSYTLQKIRKQLKGSYAVVAPTGVSAKLIGGETIHSFFQVFKKDIKSMNEKAVVRIAKIEYLIIDEISMVGDALLDKISDTLKEIKENDSPFGGVKVLMIGDFFQLRPIKENYAFYSKVWKELNIKTLYLTKKYRVDENDKLSFILDSIRYGENLEEVKKLLNERVINDEVDRDSMTFIMSHREDVERTNSEKLKAIDSKLETVIARTDKKDDDYLLQALLKNSLTSKEINIKVGALVMTIVNNPKMGYVNGTVGVITFISRDVIGIKTDKGTLSIERYDFGENKSDPTKSFIFEQFPITLAWALTTHKTQGMTISNKMLIDLSKCFTFGQGYVSLSRATKLSDIYITEAGLNHKSLLVCPTIAKIDKKMKVASDKNVKEIQ